MNKTRNCNQALTGSQQTSFLPEPDFTPKLPQKNTLAYKALLMMLAGKKISHLDFQDDTSSWRLAAYIDVLSKDGWTIKREDICFSTAVKPKQRYITKYYLDKKIIKKAKKALRGVYAWN